MLANGQAVTGSPGADGKWNRKQTAQDRPLAGRDGKGETVG